MRLFGDVDAAGFVKSVFDPEERRPLNPGRHHYREISTA